MAREAKEKNTRDGVNGSDDSHKPDDSGDRDGHINGSSDLSSAPVADPDDDPASDARVNEAVVFLSSAGVVPHPNTSKAKFLAGKGLTPAEIDKAFRIAGAGDPDSPSGGLPRTAVPVLVVSQPGTREHDGSGYGFPSWPPSLSTVGALGLAAMGFARLFGRGDAPRDGHHRTGTDGGFDADGRDSQRSPRGSGRRGDDENDGRDRIADIAASVEASSRRVEKALADIAAQMAEAAARETERFSYLRDSVRGMASQVGTARRKNPWVRSEQQNQQSQQPKDQGVEEVDNDGGNGELGNGDEHNDDGDCVSAEPSAEQVLEIRGKGKGIPPWQRKKESASEEKKKQEPAPVADKPPCCKSKGKPTND